MTTSIRPVGHHLVVRPVQLPRKSEGGIIINFKGSEAEKLQRAGRMVGQVEAIGPQCWKAHASALVDLPDALKGEALEPWCKVGDWVVYSRHAGKFIKEPTIPLAEQEDSELYVINDDDIIAVLPPQSEWKMTPTELVGF